MGEREEGELYLSTKKNAQSLSPVSRKDERRRTKVVSSFLDIEESSPSMFCYSGSASPPIQERKVLADRNVYMTTTMDEDEDALYTEVVLTDEEMAENYLEGDEDDDVVDDDVGEEEEEEDALDDLAYLQQIPPRSDVFYSYPSGARSPNDSPIRPRPAFSPYLSSNAHLAMMNNQSDDGGDADEDVRENKDKPDEEKAFRIQHLLNYDTLNTLPNQHVPATLLHTPTAPSPAVPPSWPGRRNRMSVSQQLEALMVDDKPWRSVPPIGMSVSSLSKKNYYPQQKPNSSSFLGRFARRNSRKNSANNNVLSSDEHPNGGDEENSENRLQQQTQQQQHQSFPTSARRKRGPSHVSPELVEATDEGKSQDMVVEAASQPYSDASWFGDGEESTHHRDTYWDDANYNSDEMNISNVNPETKNFYEWERPVDWNILAEYPLPTQFAQVAAVGLYPRHVFSPYSADPPSGSLFTNRRATHFVWQHGMLLQAVMELLVERDCLGVEASMDAVDNIWKKGPLKILARDNKGLRKKWKVKYVEVRRGNLCYYEDRGLDSGGRKSIHLRSGDTQIRQVFSNGPASSSVGVTTALSSSLAPPGSFMFEILQSGSPTRIWMARSEEDLQAWMRAIQMAMIGEEDDVDNGVGGGGSGDEKGALRLQELPSHHHLAIQRYTELQSKLKTMDVHEDYVKAVRTLGTGERLQIPVVWIRQKVQDLGGASNSKVSAMDRFKPFLRTAALNSSTRDPQRQIRASISDFWNNMKETAFAINGMAVSRDMPFYGERIFGSLTRCILEFDNAVVQDTEVDGFAAPVSYIDSYPSPMAAAAISELQAVSYARDILVYLLRTREQKDVLFAVNDLLRNDDLVVLSTKEVEDICHLEVSFAGEDWQDITRSEAVGANSEMTIWLHMKRKNTSWRKRFAVLSGVVLSYYEAASPRPRGLQGQLVLNRNSTVERVREMGEPYVLMLSTKDEARYLSFEDEQDMWEWKEAIQNAIYSCDENVSERDLLKESRKKGPEAADQQQQQQQPPRSSKFRVPGSRVVIGGSRVVIGGSRVVTERLRALRNRRIKAAEINSEKNRASGPSNIPERPSMELLMDEPLPPQATVPTTPAATTTTTMNKQREPTVQCVVQHSHRFLIKDRFVVATAEDMGDEKGVLFTVQAKLFQAFTMSGGPNGRLLRGNALVEINVAENDPREPCTFTCDTGEVLLLG